MAMPTGACPTGTDVATPSVDELIAVMLPLAVPLPLFTMYRYPVASLNAAATGADGMKVVPIVCRLVPSKIDSCPWPPPLGALATAMRLTPASTETMVAAPVTALTALVAVALAG